LHYCADSAPLQPSKEFVTKITTEYDKNITTSHNQARTRIFFHFFAFSSCSQAVKIRKPQYIAKNTANNHKNQRALFKIVCAATSADAVSQIISVETTFSSAQKFIALTRDCLNVKIKAIIINMIFCNLLILK
jgi:hypothetical protein